MKNRYRLNYDYKKRIVTDINLKQADVHIATKRTDLANKINLKNLSRSTLMRSDNFANSFPSEIEYVIELKRWGITQGSFGKPPYSISEWEIAYNNLLGFNSALTYAKDNGLTHIIVPHGVYSFCYTNFNGGIAAYAMINTSILLYSNQTLDLNGSTFEVMYDSINKNPYDKSPISTPAWVLSGKLIGIYDCYNTHVVNGTIIGDIPNRSFSDGGAGFNSEKGMEQTYGVSIDNGSSFCSIQNLNISLFMGDGIILGAYPSKLGTWNLSQYNTKAYPGYVDGSGNIIQKAGAYISNKIPIIKNEHKEIQMRTGGGYTRIPLIKNSTFEYVFYNSSNVLLEKKSAIYLQIVTVPFDTAYVRIQFINEAVGLPSIDISYAITKPQCNHIKILNCIIHDNHRGGISGGPDFTNIEFNKIYHNGMDSSLNIPLFPSTTRYSINFEDSYSNYITIRDNEIYSGFNGILLGAYHILVTNNYIADMQAGGITIYNTANAIIDCNTFYNASPLAVLSSIDIQERNITLTNNTVTCSVMRINVIAKSHVRILNNKFYIDSILLSGDIDVIGNHFKSYLGSRNMDYFNTDIQVSTCINNIFEDYLYGSHYRFSLVKFNASSSIKNNIFRSVGFNSVSKTNDIEIDSSEFYNCCISYPPKDKAKDFKISFNNCRLEDTTIEIGSAYINDIITGGIITLILLNRCDIKITESFLWKNIISINDNKNKDQLTGGARPRQYNAAFTDCSIDNDIISKQTYILKYLSTMDFDIFTPKKLIMERCRLKVTDPTKFKPFYSDNANCDDNIAILKDITYIGFTSFPVPTYGKLEEYSEVFTPSGTMPPTSLTLRIGTCWFNTTTKKPYWWNGTTWNDATGTSI